MISSSVSYYETWTTQFRFCRQGEWLYCSRNTNFGGPIWFTSCPHEVYLPQQNYQNMNIGYDYKECIGLKVKPRRGDALLFYSMLPNGTFDKVKSLPFCKSMLVLFPPFSHFFLAVISCRITPSSLYNCCLIYKELICHFWDSQEVGWKTWQHIWESKTVSTSKNFVSKRTCRSHGLDSEYEVHIPELQLRK